MCYSVINTELSTHLTSINMFKVKKFCHTECFTIFVTDLKAERMVITQAILQLSCKKRYGVPNDRSFPLHPIIIH